MKRSSRGRSELTHSRVVGGPRVVRLAAHPPKGSAQQNLETLARSIDGAADRDGPRCGGSEHRQLLDAPEGNSRTGAFRAIRFRTAISAESRSIHGGKFSVVTAALLQPRLTAILGQTNSDQEVNHKAKGKLLWATNPRSQCKNRQRRSTPRPTNQTRKRIKPQPPSKRLRPRGKDRQWTITDAANAALQQPSEARPGPGRVHPAGLRAIPARVVTCLGTSALAIRCTRS